MKVDESAAARTSPLNDAEPARVPESGAGLCLSGGGYRAMVFHIGVLWRFFLGGLLQTLKRHSPGGGGSPPPGLAAPPSPPLGFRPTAPTRFQHKMGKPLRNIAG